MQENAVDQEPALMAMGTGRPVIYALLTEHGDVFYVGRSSRLSDRFACHKRKYGQTIQVTILQDMFVDETPEEAEQKWITHCAQVGGAHLMNVKHLDKAYRSGTKRRHESDDASPTCGLLTVRNVDLNVWVAFQQLAKREGRTLASYLREVMLDVIEGRVALRDIFPNARIKPTDSR